MAGVNSHVNMNNRGRRSCQILATARMALDALRSILIYFDTELRKNLGRVLSQILQKRLARPFSRSPASLSFASSVSTSILILSPSLCCLRNRSQLKT